MYRPRMQRKVAARCATVAALLRFTPSLPHCRPMSPLCWCSADAASRRRRAPSATCPPSCGSGECAAWAAAAAAVFTVWPGRGIRATARRTAASRSKKTPAPP